MYVCMYIEGNNRELVEFKLVKNNKSVNIIIIKQQQQ